MVKKNKIMKKIMLGLILGSLIILAGCSNSQNDDNKQIINDNNLNVENDPIFNGNTKKIEVEAFKFGFKPSVIKVKLGDKVVLTAKSLDVPHGLAIKGYPDVNLYLDGINSDYLLL